MTLDELFAEIEAYRNDDEQTWRIVGKSLDPEPYPDWLWDLSWQVRGTLSMIEWWLVEEHGWLRSSYLDLTNYEDNPLIKRHSPWKPYVSTSSGLTFLSPISTHWIVDMLSPEARAYQFHLFMMPAGGEGEVYINTRLMTWLSWGIYHSSGSFGEYELVESLPNWRALLDKMLSLEELGIDDLRL